MTDYDGIMRNFKLLGNFYAQYLAFQKIMYSFAEIINVS